MSAVMKTDLEENTIPVAYWADGFWDKDIEGAKLIDKYGGFEGGAHVVIYLPEAATDSFIDNAVRIDIAAREGEQ